MEIILFSIFQSMISSKRIKRDRKDCLVCWPSLRHHKKSSVDTNTICTSHSTASDITRGRKQVSI